MSSRAVSRAAVVLALAAVGCGGRAYDNTEGHTHHHDAGPPPIEAGLPDAILVDAPPPIDVVVADIAVDVRPDVAPDVYVPPAGLVTIPLGGCIPEYTAPVTIG